MRLRRRADGMCAAFSVVQAAVRVIRQRDVIYFHDAPIPQRATLAELAD